MKIDLSNLQKDLTDAFQLEFILPENLEKEFNTFSAWFIAVIDKYHSEETKLKYNLELFEPHIEELYFAWLKKPKGEIYKSSLGGYFKFKHLVEHLKEYEGYQVNPENGYSYWVEKEDDNYNGEEELKNIEIHFTEFNNLLLERNINIGNWLGLSLNDYLVKEIQEKNSNKKSKQLNPVIINFFEKSDYQLIHNHQFNWPEYGTDNFNIEKFTESFKFDLLEIIIKNLKSRLNSDLGLLHKNLLRYLNSDVLSETSISIINFGIKSTKDQSGSKYSYNYFDHYLINLNFQEFTYTKKVESFAQESKVASVFLINEKHIKHLLISPEKLIERSEYIIKKDVKKLNIANDSILEIHYHGHFSPDSIVFENYESAMELLKFISDSR